MPYFTDPNLKDEEQQQAQNGVSISGASPTTEAQGGSGGSSPQAKALNTGSSFQNLDKYLKTNQSQQFGNQVLGKVGDQVKGASQNMQQASDQFKNQVTSGNQLPSQSQIDQSIQNPTQTKPEDYQSWMNQSYQGPKSLAEDPSAWNQYWSKANQADASAKQLGSESGRFALLDQYFGKPSYNFGQKSLDNLLVQNSGLGRQAHDLQNQATQLKGQGAENAKDLQGFAADRAGQVANSAQQAKSAVTGALDQSYQGVNADLAQKNAARAANQGAVSQAFANGNFSPEMLQNMGLKGGDHLYDLDLNKYLSQGAALTRDQTMSPEQRARIQALSQLSGVQDSFANGPASEASADYTFDQGKFATDQKQRQQDLLNAISQLDQQYHWDGPLNDGNRTQFNQQQAQLNQALELLQQRYGADRKIQDGTMLNFSNAGIR